MQTNLVQILEEETEDLTLFKMDCTQMNSSKPNISCVGTLNIIEIKTLETSTKNWIDRIKEVLDSLHGNHNLTPSEQWSR